MRRLFLGLLGMLALVLAVPGLAGGWVTSFGIPLLIAVPYGLVCLPLLEHHGRAGGGWPELVMDGQFYLLGAAVVIWRLAGPAF